MAQKSGASIAKQKLWGGRVLSGLAVLFLLFDGIMKFFMDKLPPEALEAGKALQWAIGAIASRVRVGNPLFTHTLFPVYIAVLIGLGLYLRDARARGIVAEPSKK